MPEDLGNGVISFGPGEDPFEWMRQNLAQANANLQPQQKEFKAGGYAVLQPSQTYGLLIIGKTYSEDEYVELERESAEKHPDPDDPFSESYARQVFQGLSEDGMLFGNWFSVAEPRGEYGDNHRIKLAGSLPKWLFDSILALIRGEG